MTRARANAIHDKVNSFLSKCDFDPNLGGTLPYANTLCILRYDPKNTAEEAWKKMDKKLIKEPKKWSWRSPPGSSTDGPDPRPDHPVPEPVAPGHRPVYPV
jgi:hypothetical protein